MQRRLAASRMRLVKAGDGVLEVEGVREGGSVKGKIIEYRPGSFLMNPARWVSGHAVLIFV